MTDTEFFLREWKRLLRVSRKAADEFRREHNRRVFRDTLLYDPEYQDVPVALYWHEEVVGMENGRATAKRVRIQ